MDFDQPSFKPPNKQDQRTRDKTEPASDCNVFIEPKPEKKPKLSKEQMFPGGMDGCYQERSDHQEALTSYVQHDGTAAAGEYDGQSKMDALLRGLGQEMKIDHLSWSETFRESEAFEALCPSRIDAILKETHQIELNLKKDKERMIKGLSIISRVLQTSDDK